MEPDEAAAINLAPLIDGVRIPGKLLLPQHPVAAVLLIPGSLNSDVDGNFAPMFPGQPPVAPHAYKDLAGQLSSSGVAVLRFAKTGPGTGSEVVDRNIATEKYKLFPQRVRVAEVFLAELEKKCPGVPYIVAGHSEGAVVASILVQAHPDVRGLVLLSGPAQPLLRMMVSQQAESDRRNGHMTPEREQQVTTALSTLEDFVASRPLPQGIGGNPYLAFFPFIVRPENAPYMRSLESVNPSAELAKVRQPVLIVQGGRDASVFPQNAEALHQVQTNATVVILPELQHFYKKVPAELPSQESFAVNSDSDPAAARAISTWIAALPAH
jgi:uncharacterized protein